MNKAFTLIELLITFVLVSAVTAALGWTLFAGFDLWISGKNRADILQSADRALETMVRWISQAATITTAGANSITFTADINGDTVTETVTFSVSGTNLQRTIGASPAVTIVPNTQSLSLTYNPAGVAAKVVAIDLTVAFSGETKTLSTSAFCRNK